jgi:hypothetical protein
MAITISGSGITSANIADGTITTDDILASDVKNLKSGRKNLIINGAMQVAQRSTSVANMGGTEGYKTLDRIKHTGVEGAGRFTSAQTTVSDLPGFANCLHLDCTTADTSIAASELLVLEYNIEGQDLQQFAKGTDSAKDITVSFYMKTNKAFTFMCVLNDFDNNRVNPQQFTTTTTWTRHSITFSGDTTGTWDDDANRSLSVSIYLHAGSDHTGGTYSADTWQSRASSDNMIAVGIGSFYDSTSNDIKITGLQMELGSVATDFEHRSYGEELALCQRYYETSFPYGETPRHGPNTTSLVSGWVTGITSNRANAGATIPFKVRKRTQPTVTKYGASNGYLGYKHINDSSDFAWNQSSAALSSPTEVGFRPSQGWSNGNSFYIQLHYTADAEL